MRVQKKISTPFTQSNPDKAIIVVNAVDPQINTMKSFIQACDDYKIGYTVVVNKIDKVQGIVKDTSIRDDLNLKDINLVSCKTNKGIKKLKTYLKLWKGKRIIVLGVFNSGKTSIINKLCGTKYKVGDIPGTTLKFTETELDDGTVVIDSIGQLIDIHKPMMVSIDFSDCSTIGEKIDKVFTEEVVGIVDTRESVKTNLKQLIKEMKKCLYHKDTKIIVTGAGASALVAKEIAGQGTECGLPVMVFTNDTAETQPISFSKGLGEAEGGISRYISRAINEGDIVIGVSASGGTGFVTDVLFRALEKKALTVAITENADTPLAHNACYLIKSDAKPEGPSSSKIQTAHLVIGHCLMLVLADELGVTADESVGYMLPETLENKKMGIK